MARECRAACAAERARAGMLEPRLYQISRVEVPT